MKKALYITLPFIFLLSSTMVSAQIPILQKFVKKVEGYKNISYTSVTKNDGFFGEYSDVIKTFQTSGKQKLQFELVTSRKREVFNGSKLLIIDLTKKYYWFEQDYRPWLYFNSISLFKLTDVINSVLQSPEKVKRLQDTMIASTNCYHIQISVGDSLVKGKRTYDRYELYLNKATYLPVYAENQMMGFMEKGGGESEETIQVITRNWYRNYKFNQQVGVNKTSVKAPAGFMSEDEYNSKKAEKGEKIEPLLAAGTDAPNWELQNLNGSYLSSADLKGKIVILDFWSNCGACILAAPTIGRLHDKYKDSDVAIVSVSLENRKEDAANFVKKYQLPYPVYVNGKAISKTYHVTPTPTFYIIDQNGKVVTAIEGFSNDLEKVITAQIDKLKQL